MNTLEEFKKSYEVELKGFSETEIKSYYMVYLEDPIQFNPSMIG